MTKDIHIVGLIGEDNNITEYPWSPVSASDVVDWREKAAQFDELFEILPNYDVIKRLKELHEKDGVPDLLTLIEKADKWDFVRPAMAKTIIEQNEKLEAIMKLYVFLEPQTSIAYPTKGHRYYYAEAIDTVKARLKEVLEGEE